MPSVSFEHLHGRRIIDSQGQRKLLTRAARQIEDLQELAVLTPGVTFAVVDQIFDRLIPMAYCREVSGRWIAGDIPVFEDHWRAGRFVGEGRERHTTIRRTVVCSPAK